MQQHTKRYQGWRCAMQSSWRFVGAAQEQVQQAETRSPASVKPLVFLHLIAAREAVLRARCSRTLAKKETEKNAALGSPFGKIDQG